MSPVQVDISLWPIAVTHLRGTPTKEQLEAYCREFEALVYSRNERYISITNLSLTGPPGAAERKVLAAWMQEHDTYLRRYSIANVTVIRSGLIRGAMTALFWLQRPPVPQHSTKTLEQAIDRALHELAADGLQTDVGDIKAWLSANRTLDA